MRRGRFERIGSAAYRCLHSLCSGPTAGTRVSRRVCKMAFSLGRLANVGAVPNVGFEGAWRHSVCIFLRVEPERYEQVPNECEEYSEVLPLDIHIHRRHCAQRSLRSIDEGNRSETVRPSKYFAAKACGESTVSPKSAEAQRMQRQDSLAPPDSQPQPAVGTKPVSRGLSTIVPLSRHGTARPAIYNGQEARNSMRHMTGGMHEMTHARCATGTIRRAECKGQQTQHATCNMRHTTCNVKHSMQHITTYNLQRTRCARQRNAMRTSRCSWLQRRAGDTDPVLVCTDRCTRPARHRPY